MLCLGWMSVYASFIKLLKSDAPTRPNHMTDLRRGKSAYIPVFIPNSAAHVDFIDSLMHISPTSQK